MTRLTIREKIRFFRIFRGALKKLERKKNASKDHWRTANHKYLLTRLWEEYNELDEAVINEHSSEDIIDECYDIINFALFVADNEGEK